MQVNGNQWKSVKFDLAIPKTLEPMVTKFGVGDANQLRVVKRVRKKLLHCSLTT